MSPAAAKPAPSDLAAEIDRLAAAGLSGLGYSEPDIERCAALTWRINRLKAESRAVIPAHVYQRAEILLGIADFKGDSYKLARLCSETDARRIVFCGVRFMAETAKILNPDKEVLLPALDAGCSLAESVTADDVRRLKAEHPGAPVASYINTSAAVKAESDVIVTSSNAGTILRALFSSHPKVLFLPDEWMGRNLALELGKEAGRELVVWSGKCVVHENFDPGAAAFYRRLHPGVRLLAHAECSPALIRTVDFVGGTGDMLRYVSRNPAPSYMLITECGLGDLARAEFPDKTFIPMCRLCPYMKATDLSRVLDVLERPTPERRIELDPAIAARARRPIERMFELAEAR